MSVTIVKPHKKISRPVTAADFSTVIEDALAMQEYVKSKKTCVGLAHSQVESKDPLRFFVTRDYLFINPEIIRHSGYTVDSREGCMTFPGKEMVVKQRWHKVEFSYQGIIRNEDGTVSPTEVLTNNVSGLDAFIVQHELDHLNGIYCYD